MSFPLTNAAVYDTCSSFCSVNTDSTISNALLSGHSDILTADAESGRVSCGSGANVPA